MTKTIKVATTTSGKRKLKYVGSKDPVVIFQGRAMLQSEKKEILAQKQIR